MGENVKAAIKDVNGAWRIDLSIKFGDVAGEENEQEFNVNQSKCDSSSCTGSE